MRDFNCYSYLYIRFNFFFFSELEMLVVDELYKEAVENTTRKLIIFNGELDRIRSGCILFYSIFIVVV